MGVIGNLIIRITTNLSEFKRELNEAGKEAEETGKKVEDQANKAGKSVEGLGSQLRALLSVGAAAGAARLAAQAITSATSDAFAVARTDLALQGLEGVRGVGVDIQSARLEGRQTPLEAARRQGRLRALAASAEDRERIEAQVQQLREEQVFGPISREQLSDFSSFLRRAKRFLYGDTLFGGPEESDISGFFDRVAGVDTSGRTRNTLENQVGQLRLGGRLRTQQLFAAGDQLAEAQFEAQFRGLTDPGAFVDTTERLIEELRLLRTSIENGRN